MGRRKKEECELLKDNAIKALIQTNWNITAVAKEFGVSRPTLYQWKNEYEKAGRSDSSVILTRADAAMTIENYRKQIAERNYRGVNELVEKLLARAEKLIDSEPDIARISVCIRAVSELIKTLYPDEMKEGQMPQSPTRLVNLFQQTIFQLNNANK